MLQPEQDRRDAGPGEQWQPVGPRLEMRPDQFPPLQRRLDAIVVRRARPQQHPVARLGDEFAAGMAEAAAAADRMDQQPVVDAVPADGAIARCFMEMSGQQAVRALDVGLR